MGAPMDPKKEEKSHEDEYNGFAEDFEQGSDEAVASAATAPNDEMGANIATRCSRCEVALGPASEKQPAEVHMERGAICLNHCMLCEDTSLLLTEATDAQRIMATRDRDTWLMTTSKFSELQGKLNRTPTVMELFVEVTPNVVGVARGQVKEELPSMASVATAKGDGKDLAPAATAKGDADDPSSSKVRGGMKTCWSHWSQIKEEEALLFQETSQDKRWR